jgi:RNA polymerase sigma factor (sigma-70 family)
MKINPAEIRAMVRIATSRTGSPVHDEDLEQQVALHALEASRRLQHIDHPRALLMKIVHDTVREYWRRRRICEDINGVEERFLCELPSFELKLDAERRAELLHRALESLPERKRILLDLFYLQEKSIPEIARLLGKSRSAVKMELLRSRRILRPLVRSLAHNKSRRLR